MIQFVSGFLRTAHFLHRFRTNSGLLLLVFLSIFATDFLILNLALAKVK